MHPSEFLPAVGNDDVSSWTLDECAAYVDCAIEAHGEMSAEAGMGAMSLGYGVDGAYAAAGAVPRPESDPLFVEANARLEAARPAPAAPVVPIADDDIPF